MANLAVRHVDTELAEATRHAYQQALGVVVCGRLNATLFWRDLDTSWRNIEAVVFGRFTCPTLWGS